MKLIKKIKTFFWYHLGKKDVTFDSKLSNYIPDVLFEREAYMYLVKYNEDIDSYTCIVAPFKQRYIV